MRILVTFATKAEFSPWSSRHPFVPYEFENWETRRAFDLFKANVGPHEVTVLLTGIGPENAANAMLSLPLELHDLCISTGLTGSLDAALQPGDIIVPRNLETLDETARIAADASLVAIAVTSGAQPVQVALTSARIIATAEAKQELSRKGSIVEMESTYVLAAARQKLVPSVAVRAVSDAADEDLPVDFARVLDSRGHLRIGGLLKELGLSPYRIPMLFQFGRQSRAAAKSLADFLDRYIAAISRSWSRVSSPPMPSIEEVSAT